MKREPIEKPEKYGCGCCGTPTKVLTDETIFFPGDVHTLMLTIDGKENEQIAPDGLVISMINYRFYKELADCKSAELRHETPLHDEAYEYNPEDGKWYLVAQGNGYA